MLVLISMVLVVRLSHGFFFPVSGGGCQCATACPQPVTCAPVPTCAIPLPCPSQTSYAAPAPAYQYQGSWSNGVAAQYQLPASNPISSSYQAISYQTPAVSYQTVQPTYQTIDPVYTTYQTAEPVYQSVQPVYQTVIPSPTTNYVAPQTEARYISPVQPTEPVQTDSYRESAKSGGEYATPTPTSESGYSANTYSTPRLQTIDSTSYDDTAAPLPPPVPSTPSEAPSSVGYGDPNDITEINIHDNEARLRPSTKMESLQHYDRSENSIELLGTHHSQSTIEPWSGTSAHQGIYTSEGFSPYMRYMKRHWILKRLRNARQLAAAVPRTTATCNSQKLANVMAKVMVSDVSVSKRAILQATEMAFDKDKFDAFCANGEFSYSIHSRKYCEVTKNDVTCFAFR